MGGPTVTDTLLSPSATTAAPSATTAAPASAVKEPKPRSEGADLLAAMSALPAGHPSRPALREQTINAFAPLAQHLANRYHGRGEPLDDLVQTAMIGLIKAVDRFDPERGVDFVGYAIPTIIGEIKRHFRDRTWGVRVPRRLQELRLAISEANTVLSHSLGRSPTVADVAAHLNITEEEVLEGLEGARAYNSVSLSTPMSSDSGSELGDMLGEADPEFAQAELKVALEPALATLDPREQKIVIQRFYGNLTQSQIAEQIGVSQMHVSRLLSKALVKLRGQLADLG
jgi:RNA polymerase sigma-B factor